MKKKIILITVILIVLLLIIVYFKTRTTMICTYTNSNDIYYIETKYKVKYKNDKVLSLYTKEVIMSDDDNMLKEYKSTLDLVYSKYNELKYYNNNMRIEDNKLISETKVNYEKIDIEEFLKVDESNINIVRNKQVSLKKIRKIYKENGARCTYR